MPAPDRYILDLPIDGELWDIWEHIAKDDLEAADRVARAAHETFRLLALNPGIGKRGRFQNPHLKEIYFRHVVGFDSYLVFYRKVPEGVLVIHVLHKARDVEAVMSKR